MPHQCVRCKKHYEDGAKEVLKGCSCGAKLFFFIKKEKLQQVKDEIEKIKLTPSQRKQMEDDIFDLVGSEIDKEHPVVLDFESIRVLQPGKYHLDLVHLFKGEPLVFRLEEGKYMIDIAKTFENLKGKDE